jgi:hypothetical protein
MAKLQLVSMAKKQLLFDLFVDVHLLKYGQ